ncbi:isoamylase early set domain-containing protein [bacterium]|nr:isoamylase early set domain-containing protein [bacterium]
MFTFNAKTRKAVFQLELPEAHSISLLGDFNEWDHTKNAMKKSKNGIWTAEIKLAPGEYQFLYFVDENRWLTDDQCPRTTSEVGTENSIAVIVAPKPAKTAPKKVRATKKK